ncbi:hypothetical protein HYO65_gp110 [Tenacibaculum phage PTm1]|uniref:Uncharacterized protein n=2 Tax=Shirahamavirus PTm1 TaxID=2846435 RepID=A0A5S9BZ16_9CAUD|nr:hypothetical protein HYO65_gp110 [Tenacibaculum phage PTm1]BBI90502.1 hypothetical protein [Tenacibaculum phage PTm1]BBI90810.1 hypothetical protein [Tenacibaculum phage PTm5]
MKPLYESITEIFSINNDLLLIECALSSVSSTTQVNESYNVELTVEQIVEILESAEPTLVYENIKARAPKLKGKAEKARKNKAKLMSAVMKNKEVQNAVTKLRTLIGRVAKSMSSETGVSAKQVTKALDSKLKI